jgi:glyoxylase-like metal-dependent hydrolase (beta-lactamase superfamily II)
MSNVYFLEIARSGKAPTTIITAETMIPEFVPFPLGFAYIEERSGRKILVDIGFTEKEWNTTYSPGVQSGSMKGFGFPLEALARLKVAPDDITDIVLTHLHLDHAAGMNQFPKARFHVQKAELQFAITAPEFTFTAHGHYYPETVVDIVRLAYAGRVAILDGDRELFPGIRAVHTPGHTPGHQCVTVQTDAGMVTILGDAAHSYGNFIDEKPGAINTNMLQGLQSYRKIKALPGFDPDRLVVFHGIEVTKFPEVAEHVYKING